MTKADLSELVETVSCDPISINKLIEIRAGETGLTVILSLECCIMMFLNFYIAGPTYCFILMYTCGLTIATKRICCVIG